MAFIIGIYYKCAEKARNSEYINMKCIVTTSILTYTITDTNIPICQNLSLTRYYPFRRRFAWYFIMLTDGY